MWNVREWDIQPFTNNSHVFFNVFKFSYKIYKYLPLIVRYILNLIPAIP